MTTFSDQLARLVTTERRAADTTNDPARISDMLVSLANETGRTIAAEGQGSEGRNLMAWGSCAIINETATGGAATVAEIQSRGM